MRKILEWLDKQLDKLVRLQLPPTWDDIDLIGECDTCGAWYDVSSRENRCGNCGDCGKCCMHTLCEECEDPIFTDGPNKGCDHCMARVINMTFAGFAGSWYDQPEPAEGLIWCPICQADTDASWEWTWAYCHTGEHEVRLDLDDGIDPDLAYEESREREYENKHGN